MCDHDQDDVDVATSFIRHGIPRLVDSDHWNEITLARKESLFGIVALDCPLESCVGLGTVVV